MALNLKNEKVERLAADIAARTGESKTAAILRALEERQQRLSAQPSSARRLDQIIAFLKAEVWPKIPRKLKGRRLSKRERERILGYGKGGV